MFLAIKSCTFGKIGCLNYRHFSSSRQQKHKQRKLYSTVKMNICILETTTSPITTSGLHFCCLSRADLLIHCFTLFILLLFILVYFNITQETCSTLHTTTPMPVVLFLFNSVCLFCVILSRSCLIGPVKYA